MDCTRTSAARLLVAGTLVLAAGCNLGSKDYGYRSPPPASNSSGNGCPEPWTPYWLDDARAGDEDVADIWNAADIPWDTGDNWGYVPDGVEVMDELVEDAEIIDDVKAGELLDGDALEELQEVACVPDCVDKACGPDGCGGECGSCDDLDPCTSDVCTQQGHCVSTCSICTVGCDCTASLVYDFDPCGPGGWTTTGGFQPAPCQNQTEGGSCALVAGDPDACAGHMAVTHSPVLDLTLASSLTVTFSVHWGGAAPFHFSDPFYLAIDQVLSVDGDLVGMPLQIWAKPCSNAFDGECSQQPIAAPCDALGCLPFVADDWQTYEAGVGLGAVEWILPEQRLARLVFTAGSPDPAVLISVDDIIITPNCP